MSNSDTDQTKSDSTDDEELNNVDERIQDLDVKVLDPAILVVREAKFTYTREQLIEIGKSDASNRRPEFLHPNELCFSILYPDKWPSEKKKSDQSDGNNYKNNENNDNRRRSGDPRERIRKEYDGIVLSPQRRSFNSGCFVPANKETNRSNNRNHSPLGSKGSDSSHGGGMVSSGNTRRIGSGRIVRESWELGDKESNENDFNFTRSHSRDDRNNNRDENKLNNDRRAFGDSIRDKDKDGRRSGRYNDRRKYGNLEKEDEPEWFSSGPVSQNDTIELRGFDDSEQIVKKKSTSRLKRNNKERNNNSKEYQPKKKDVQPITEENETDSGEQLNKQSLSTIDKQEPDKIKKSNGEDIEKVSTNSGEAENETETADEQQLSVQQSDHSYTFEEFFKCDNIQSFLTNGVGDGNKETSRFSQWFKKESPNKELLDSPRSSIQEDNHIIKGVLKDINESNSVPIHVHTASTNSSAYFTPISPASQSASGCLGGIIGSKSSSSSSSMFGESISIMDMLSRSQDSWNSESSKGKKFMNVLEVEASIRPNSESSTEQQQKTSSQKPDKEMAAAFKKMLQQATEQQQQAEATVTTTQNHNMHKSQGMSLLEMLNHSEQQDEARVTAQQHQLLNALNVSQQQQAQFPTDFLKMQPTHFQKIDVLNKIMAAQFRTSPLMDMGTQQSRELLNRPEAQAILQGLKRGEITNQHIHQQLNNPALQPRHRDMLLMILKIHNNSTASHHYGGPSASNSRISPIQMSSQHQQHLYHHHHHHQAQQQQQQQLRVSPSAMHQRPPTTLELQVYTQSIMQRALIKKKLEEQNENFRKKQELRVASPALVGTAKGMSPTPLAFTPTSVLRKMTAEKDEGKENKIVTENIGKPMQGRALMGMRHQHQQQQQPLSTGNQQWNYQMKQSGRPIVKANPTYQSQTPDQFFAQAQQQQPQQRLYQALQQQQQQQQQQFPSTGLPYALTQTQYSQFSPNSFTQSQTQLTPQQMRAQHQHRPAGNNQEIKVEKSSSSLDNGIAAVQQQQQTNDSWQQFLNNAAVQQQQQQQNSARQQKSTQQFATPTNSSSNASAATPSTPAPSSSSTTANDQLARWFSPDLLERARGGELPSTANLARHALSLEEIERPTAPPVQN